MEKSKTLSFQEFKFRKKMDINLKDKLIMDLLLMMIIEKRMRLQVARELYVKQLKKQIKK